MITEQEMKTLHGEIDFTIMKTLQDLNDRINELQQIIDLESDEANEGCVSSQQLIINSESELEQIRDAIDQLAIANCLV